MRAQRGWQYGQALSFVTGIICVPSTILDNNTSSISLSLLAATSTGPTTSFAADHVRFGSPEINLGLIPGWGATQRLSRQLPWALAARMLLTGEPVSAEEALRMGLVNAVVPSGNLMEASLALAHTLCQRGPLAIRAAKLAMIEGSDKVLTTA